MGEQHQAVSNVIEELLKVTSHYLSDEEVDKLAGLWHGFDKVSATMIQECMADIIRLYPDLKPNESQIRRAFWGIVQNTTNKNIKMSSTTISANRHQSHADIDPSIQIQATNASQVAPISSALKKRKEAKLINERRKALKAVQETMTNPKTKQQSVKNESIQTFYTVLEAVKKQLSHSDQQSLFTLMGQIIREDPLLNSYRIDMVQFMTKPEPDVPNSTQALNNLVQTMYIGLCDIVGPSSADDILFLSAQAAKQRHSRAIVERLF